MVSSKGNSEAPSIIADLADIRIPSTRNAMPSEAEVTDALLRASTGELPMVETLTDRERKLSQRFFAWIASNGVAHLWPLIKAIVSHAIPRFGLDGDGFHDVDLWPEFPKIPEEWGLPPLDPALPSYDDLGIALREFIKQADDDFDRLGAKGMAVLTVSYLFYDEFHYPQPENNTYDIADDMFEKLKWVYRYWFNQLEVAERGCGLEQHFLGQMLLNPVIIPVSSDGRKDVGAEAQRVTLTAAGDVLAVDALLTGDTSELFDDITDFFKTADIVSANLESTVDESKPRGRHQPDAMPARMNTSQQMFDKFVDEAGINFFPTATNHAFDWDDSGVIATLDVLDASGALHAGTSRSTEEQDEVVVVEHDGVKIALLSYAFDLNGHPLPKDHRYYANEVRFNDANPLPDYGLVERHVRRARDRGAEFIVAYCHWGWEFEMYPHVNIRDAAHNLVDLGIDVILGNHPHVSQPAEVIRREGRESALVTYAFGDFVSYHPYSRNSKLAYGVEFEIVKKRVGQRTVVSWDHVRAQPFYIVNAHRGGDDYDCRIVRFEKVLANPNYYGLTDREIYELDHLRDVVWERILAPLSHTPDSGWSD